MTNPLNAKRYAKGAALIVGGSGGVGRAICRELAASGSDIALTYNTNEASAAEAVKEIESLGRRAIAGKVDMRDAASVRSFADRVRTTLGGIHTSVYAAGPPLPLRFISKIEPEVFQEKVGADIFGCFNLVAATIADLRESQGVLLAVGTPAVWQTVKSDVLSAAPKAAIDALVRGVAAEEGRYGVRANCIGVGVISDGMFNQLVAEGHFDSKFIAKTKEIVALGRLGTAQEVANVFAFLASDKASYVSGQYIMADGGFAI